MYIHNALDNKNERKSLDCGMVATPCTTEEKAMPMEQCGCRTEHCEERFVI